jgi:hypothetical protein
VIGVVDVNVVGLEEKSGYQVCTVLDASDWKTVTYANAS